MLDNVLKGLEKFYYHSALLTIGYQEMIMISIGCLLIFLAITKQYEPLLLIPIGFGALLANLPLSGLNDPNGLLDMFRWGIKSGLFPPIIFLGVGAMTDFGPLIANPKTFLLGAAAQFGIFMTLIGALLLNFKLPEACAIGIIGGADGPTTIFLTNKLAPELLGPITVAAYSYMALIPIIQPPIMKMLTTKKERSIAMIQTREVSKIVKLIFPLVILLVSAICVPDSAALIGMLMFGNLLRESGVTERLSKTAQNELINIITIFLGLAVGSSLTAANFLKQDSLFIFLLGLFSFMFGTAGGIIIGKILCKLTKGKINPLIGAAGVSAVPMAARVVQKIGQKENPSNFLLMHAMGPNVAGVIGSAVAAGILLAIVKN
ncbi:MAG TPA: sodium ion-translocating decarboxylase subunit beta [bacterium]|nr:sodium ion-translocating decarboxylase subunit beta [bacterium]